MVVMVAQWLETVQGWSGLCSELETRLGYLVRASQLHLGVRQQLKYILS